MMIGIIHQKCQNKVFRLAKKAVAAIVIEFSLDLSLISFESGLKKIGSEVFSKNSSIHIFAFLGIFKKFWGLLILTFLIYDLMLIMFFENTPPLGIDVIHSSVCSFSA